jgi:hypothetical protein
VPATGTFISIDKFTKFCSRLRTEHYMHMINVMVLLYHRSCYRISVLFVFMQFISHLQRKENSCYIMLKIVLYLFMIARLFNGFNCIFDALYKNVRFFSFCNSSMFSYKPVANKNTGRSCLTKI